MTITFLEGSAAGHPNFDRYLRDSLVQGSLPLRFDCAATAAVTVAEVTAQALHDLESQAEQEQADVLEDTLCATLVHEPSGHTRYRVLVIARQRKPVVESTVVREPTESREA